MMKKIISIDLRPAEREDIASLQSLYRDLDKYHMENLPEIFDNKDYTRPYSFFEDLIDYEGNLLILAENHGEILGFVEAYFFEDEGFGTNKKREWIEIDNIFVKEEYRKMGIGSYLLGEIEYIAEENGISDMELKVYAFNEEALSFYRDHGFEPLSHRLKKRYRRTFNEDYCSWWRWLLWMAHCPAPVKSRP